MLTDIARYFYVNNGGNLESAVSDATRWLYDKATPVDDNRHGSYVVPAKLGYDANKIDSNAILLKSDVVREIVKNKDVDYPGKWGSTEAYKQQYLHSLRKDSRWINNKNNSGLVLAYGASPVLHADGRPYEFGFGFINQIDVMSGVEKTSEKVKIKSIKEGF